MASEITDEITTNPKWRVKILPRITSCAKKIPARGALKVAEIPPAAPQATRVFTHSVDKPRAWPSAEPTVEPICTMGPSLPTGTATSNTDG